MEKEKEILKSNIARWEAYVSMAAEAGNSELEKELREEVEVMKLELEYVEGFEEAHEDDFNQAKYEQ